MFIGDILDRMISIAFGIIIIVMSFKPALFIKNETSLENFKKKKPFFLLIGFILISFGTVFIILKFVNR